MPLSAKIPCKRRSQPPKICGMVLRKFINELFLVSPLVLLGAITVHARTAVNAFEPTQYSPTMNSRIAAYIEPVRFVEKELYGGYYNADSYRVRQVGKMWRDLTMSGVLKALPPEAKDDNTRDGIKGQIRKAADELASGLQYIAKQELKGGNYYLAAQDAVLALEAVEGIKYSDLYSVGMFSIRQEASVDLIRQIAPKLEEHERALLQERLDRIQGREKPITEVVMAEQRVHRLADPDSMPIERDDVAIALDMARALDAGEMEKAGALAERLARIAKVSENDTFLPAFRFAWNATRNSMNRWRTLDLSLRKLPTL